MFKKRIIYLLLASILPTIAIGSLYVLSNEEKARRDGFIRSEPPHLVQPGDIRDMKVSSFYIAGLTRDSIYISNKTNPYVLMAIGFDVKKAPSWHILHWPKQIRIAKGSMISADSDKVYLNDGFIGQRTSLSLKNQSSYSVVKSYPFTLLTAAGNVGLIYRSLERSEENVLVRQSGPLNTAIINKHLLIKQGDGIFSTDGLLFSDISHTKAVYVYYYRNQFLCLDSNMKLRYTGKTIDTISHAQIKLSHIKSEGTITMSTPPLFVNKTACANDKYIFIHSNLTANNESPEVLNGFAIIDVYNLDNGKYKLSFYLPDVGRRKLTNFGVYGNKLVAIYGRYLTVYQLRF